MSDSVATENNTLSLSGTPAWDAAHDLVGANPVATIIVSAAAGAGLVALLALANRDSSGPLQSVNNLRGAGEKAYDKLQAQLSDLAQVVLAALPSKDDMQRSASAAGDRASDAWGNVREQTRSVLAQVAPKVDATRAMARENPMWVALVVGVIGALVGSLVTGRGKKDSVS